MIDRQTEIDNWKVYVHNLPNRTLQGVPWCPQSRDAPLACCFCPMWWRGMEWATHHYSQKKIRIQIVEKKWPQENKLQVAQLLELRFNECYRREGREYKSQGYGTSLEIVFVNSDSDSMLLPKLPQLPQASGADLVSLYCCWNGAVRLWALHYHQFASILDKTETGLKWNVFTRLIMTYVMHAWALCLTVFSNPKCVPMSMTYSS